MWGDFQMTFVYINFAVVQRPKNNFEKIKARKNLIFLYLLFGKISFNFNT